MSKTKIITEDSIFRGQVKIKQAIVSSGPGSPEGAISAPIGSLYLSRTADNGQLWEKRTGGGNTGWVKVGMGLTPTKPRVQLSVATIGASLIANKDNYIASTASGLIRVDKDSFPADQEIIGEMEIGSREFTAAEGVTLRYPSAQGLIAPEGSRFSIKFKTPNDALVTIYPGSYMSSITTENENTGSIVLAPTSNVYEEKLIFTGSGSVTFNGFNATATDRTLIVINLTGNDITIPAMAAISVPFAESGTIPDNQAARFQVVNNLILKEG